MMLYLFICSLSLNELVNWFSVCGMKVDLDLGNYERFLNVKLTRDNNITTGKIYQVFDNLDQTHCYFHFLKPLYDALKERRNFFSVRKKNGELMLLKLSYGEQPCWALKQLWLVLTWSKPSCPGMQPEAVIVLAFY